MNIGIFSGSFNPIHAGHFILANFITEFTDMDEVWFLVTPQNPLKDNQILVDQHFRLEMVKRAVADYPKLKASDFEFSLPQPSYTINTLEKLSSVYPKHQFTLIVGADNWATFDKWYNYQKILDNYNIYVYPRLNSSVVIPESLSDRVKLLSSPIIEISSTFIRNGIAQEKDLKAFMPTEVYEYIYAKGLYR